MSGRASAATVARDVRVSGRVQGVWFRKWTEEQARELGVVGWVRNLPDGSVQAWLQGDEVAVDELVARIARGGPAAARVDAVEASPTDPAPGLDGFRIRA